MVFCRYKSGTQGGMAEEQPRVPTYGLSMWAGFLAMVGGDFPTGGLWEASIVRRPSGSHMTFSSPSTILYWSRRSEPAQNQQGDIDSTP